MLAPPGRLALVKGSKNPSSFTPQQSFGPKRVVRNRQRVIVDVSVSIVFVVTLLLAGAALGYRYYLEQELATIQQTFENNVTELDDAAYNEIRMHDRKVQAAEFLLDHKTLHAPIFTALEDTTAQNVAYQSFQSRHVGNTRTEILLGGLSEEFADLVVQARSYSGEPLFADRSLSQIMYNEDTSLGTAVQLVLFDFSADIPAANIAWTGDEEAIADVAASATLSTPDTGVVEAETATTTAEEVDVPADEVNQ